MRIEVTSKTGGRMTLDVRGSKVYVSESNEYFPKSVLKTELQRLQLEGCTIKVIQSKEELKAQMDYVNSFDQ
jgi:hypothetical protein